MNRSCENCIHYDVCRKPMEYSAYPDDCPKYEEPRPHGEWIPMTDLDGRILGYKCKTCGWLKPHDKMPFCENCGDDMRKEGDSK